MFIFQILIDLIGFLVNTVNMSKNKELILDVARDIFLNDGLQSLSMRKVAKKVGISATAIYRHYSSKEELLFFVLLRGYSFFKSYLLKVTEPNTLECLKQTTDAYLDFALNERAYYRTLFMSGDEVVDVRKRYPQHAEKVIESFLILQHRVDLFFADKAYVDKNSYETAFSIWAYAHGQVSLFLQKRTGLEEDSFKTLYKKNMYHFLNNI